MNTFFKYMSTGIVLVLVAACAAKAPVVQSGTNTKVSVDGLHFVENTKMDEVWFDPEVDLSKYSKILIVGLGIHYIGDDPDIKQRNKFEDIVKSTFRDELSQLVGYEFADAAGEDTLLMHAALVNVDLIDSSTKPGVRKYARSMGTVELVIDLRDSISGAPIILAKDNKSIKSGATEMQNVSELSFSQMTKLTARSWAKLIRKRLDELAAYPSNDF